jgi:C-terminal processing protease CtpA/Prc
VFGAGSLGLELANSDSSISSVVCQKIVKGSQAERLGINIGDLVLAVEGINEFVDVKSLIDLIKLYPRPVRMTFMRMPA